MGNKRLSRDHCGVSRHPPSPPAPRPQAREGSTSWTAVKVLLLLALLLVGLGPRPGMGQESLAERRTRVEGLSLAEKEQLLRRQDRFAGLDPAEQNHLRQLNRDLQQDPNAPRLREVMRRYYDWLKTLTPYQRIELSQLSPEKRIERIKKLMQEQSSRPPRLQETRRVEAIKRAVQQQAKKLGEQLESQDIVGLFEWIAEVSERESSRFLENLPDSRSKALRQQLENVRDPQRRRLIFAWLWMQWQSANPGKLPPLNHEDLAALRRKLSRATRERLESRPPLEQWRIVADWISLLPQEKLIPRRASELISEETERKLAMFFEHVLTEEEKDRLLAMPSEQMFRELWREYTRAEVSRTPLRPAEQSGVGKRPGQRGKGGKAGQNAASSGAAKTPARPSKKRTD